VPERHSNAPEEIPLSQALDGGKVGELYVPLNIELRERVNSKKSKR